MTRFNVEIFEIGIQFVGNSACALVFSGQWWIKLCGVNVPFLRVWKRCYPFLWNDLYGDLACSLFSFWAAWRHRVKNKAWGKLGQLRLGGMYAILLDISSPFQLPKRELENMLTKKRLVLILNREQIDVISILHPFTTSHRKIRNGWWKEGAFRNEKKRSIKGALSNNHLATHSFGSLLHGSLFFQLFNLLFRLFSFFGW